MIWISLGFGFICVAEIVGNSLLMRNRREKVALTHNSVKNNEIPLPQIPIISDERADSGF
jgi:hypothetical protein